MRSGVRQPPRHRHAAAAGRANGGVPDERLLADVAGAADHLRGLANSNGRVGVIGFCSGGRQSVLAACHLDLDAAVDCYGAMVTGTVPEGLPVKWTTLQDTLPDLRCPLLGLFGADDKNPTPDETKVIEQALQKHGKAYEFHTYEGQPHMPDPATWNRHLELLLAFFGRALSG